METKEIIKRLAEPYAASGCEKNVFSALKEMLEPHGEVYSDNMNNLFCTFGSGYHILRNGSCCGGKRNASRSYFNLASAFAKRG